jgi:hypothetical protein
MMQYIRILSVRRIFWLPVALILAYLAPRAAASDGMEDLVLRAASIKADYAADAKKLSAWCDERGLKEQAKISRSAFEGGDSYTILLPALRPEIGPPPLPAGASDDVEQWSVRWAGLRRDYALRLFELAQQAAKAKQPALAFHSTIDALRVDPDCEPARKVLGYQKYQGAWRTAYEIKRLSAGEVWHDKYGWIAKDQVARYEQGQRPSGKNWVAASKDAQSHRTIETGWTVQTEHYSVLTDSSLEGGAEIAAKLERLQGVWRQLFFSYYATESYAMSLFGDRPQSLPDTGKFDVVYYRDRKEYNRALKELVPNIEITIGFYSERMQRACFFAGKDSDDRNLYHEATHQLFHQSRYVAPNVGMRANFWIIEGVAMFMETLRREGDCLALGGADDERMLAAQYRLLKDKFYVPLSDVVRFNMESLQQNKQIAKLYSQFAGLTNFLVFYDGGRYRDALVTYLAAVYAGRDNTETLSLLTGKSYEELDRQYREFMLDTAKLAQERDN